MEVEKSGSSSSEKSGSSSSEKRGAEEAASEEKTAKYLRKLHRKELKRKERRRGEDDEREEVNDVVIAGLVVNKEAVEVTTEIDKLLEAEEGEDDELDVEQVKVGRKEEVDYMIEKVKMFEFGSYDEVVRRGGKTPTTAKWVEGWKADEKGGRSVRCRLVGRDFKKRGVEERQGLFAAKVAE